MRKATDQDKLSMFQNYEAFIFDLDGTLWRGSQLIPGAKEFIDTLKYYNKKVFYVTNNASKSRQGYISKLVSLGLPADQGDVYSSSYAAAAYLKGLKFKKKAYVIGEEGIVQELQAEGIKAVGGPEHKDMHVDWNSSDPEIKLDPEIGAVVVGIDRYINYYKLQYATLLLTERPDCLFVACNTDARGHFSPKQEWAGAGTMVGAIIGSTEKEPIVVGKPSPYILDHLCQAHGLRRQQCLIIGDRLDTDIQWGNELGAGTCCVLTGVTSEQQLLSADEKLQPLYYVDSVGDFMSIKSQLPMSCSIQ